MERQAISMMTTKVINDGRSQVVRLPKEYWFTTDEVMVNRIGEIVILAPKTNNWESFAKAIDMFSEDFMEDGRASQYNMERESL